MKYSYYLLTAAVSVLMLASCDKTKVPEYVPAESVASGEQVFFPATVPDQFIMDLADVSFSVPVSRGSVSKEALDVEISANGDGLEYFSIPGILSFASNASTADLVISVKDASAMEVGTFYDLTLSIADEELTTPYGRNTVSVKAGFDYPWEKFDKGVFYEFWSDREVDQLVEYQQISATWRRCRVEGYLADDENEGFTFYWYWDTETNYCFVPPTVLEPYDGSNNCIVSDMASFYTKYKGWESEPTVGPIGSDTWYAWAGPWMSSRSDIPYYDGNGTFHLGDWFYIASNKDGVPTGSGWLFGGDGDYFKGKSFGDYTLNLSYGGMYVSPKMEVFPIINFASTKKSAKYYDTVKYIITTQDADPAEVEAAIVAGESEDIQTATLKDGAVEAQPVLEPGKYMVVAVPYVKGDKNDDGESTEYKTLFTAVLNFNFAGIGGENTALVEGAYSMTYSSFSSTFNVIGTDDPEHFYVENLGIENGAMWHATYDPDALTLTLDGTEVDYESYGNQFGEYYGYFNSEHTQVYALCVYDSDESTGNDALVFTVDKGTREIVSVNQTLTVEVYLLEDGSLLGYAAAFPAGTAVVAGTASGAPASASANLSPSADYGVGRTSVARGSKVMHESAVGFTQLHRRQNFVLSQITSQETL